MAHFPHSESHFGDRLTVVNDLSCCRLIGWLDFGRKKGGNLIKMAGGSGGGGVSASTRRRQARWSHPAECFKTPRCLRELTAAVTLLYCILDDSGSLQWELDCPCHSFGSVCPGGGQPSSHTSEIRLFFPPQMRHYPAAIHCKVSGHTWKNVCNFLQK